MKSQRDRRKDISDEVREFFEGEEVNWDKYLELCEKVWGRPSQDSEEGALARGALDVIFSRLLERGIISNNGGYRLEVYDKTVELRYLLIEEKGLVFTKPEEAERLGKSLEEAVGVQYYEVRGKNRQVL